MTHWLHYNEEEESEEDLCIPIYSGSTFLYTKVKEGDSFSSQCADYFGFEIEYDLCEEIEILYYNGFDNNSNMSVSWKMFEGFDDRKLKLLMEKAGVPPPDPEDLDPEVWNKVKDVYEVSDSNRQWYINGEYYCDYFAFDEEGNAHFGTDYTATQAGLWDNVATWGGGGFPVTTDTATTNNYIVTIQGPETCGNVTIGGSGTLRFDGQLNTVAATLDLDNGATLANSGVVDQTGTGSTGYAGLAGVSAEPFTGTQPTLGDGYWDVNQIDFQMNITSGGGGCTFEVTGDTAHRTFTCTAADTYKCVTAGVQVTNRNTLIHGTGEITGGSGNEVDFTQSVYQMIFYTGSTCDVQYMTITGTGISPFGINDGATVTQVDNISVTTTNTTAFSNDHQTAYAVTNSTFSGSTQDVYCTTAGQVILDTCTFTTTGLQATSGWILADDGSSNFEFWGILASSETPLAGYRAADITGNFTTSQADVYGTPFTTSYTLGANMVNVDAATISASTAFDTNVSNFTCDVAGDNNVMIVNGDVTFGSGTHSVGASSTFWGCSIGATADVDEETAIMTYGTINVGNGAVYTQSSNTTTFVSSYNQATNDTVNIDAGATYTNSNGEFIFTEASTQSINNGNATNPYDLTVNNAACVLQLEVNNLEIDNNLTVTLGTLDTEGNAGVDRDLLVANLTDITDTLDCNGSNISLGSTLAGATEALTIHSGGIFIGGTGPHTMGSINDLTGATYTATSDVTTINGRDTSTVIFTPAGVFNNGGGTITVTQNIGASIMDIRSMGADTFYNLIVNTPQSVALFHTLGGNTVGVSNDLSITQGTLNTTSIADVNLIVTGDIDNTDTLITNSSTITANGNITNNAAGNIVPDDGCDFVGDGATVWLEYGTTDWDNGGAASAVSLTDLTYALKTDTATGGAGVTITLDGVNIRADLDDGGGADKNRMFTITANDDVVIAGNCGYVNNGDAANAASLWIQGDISYTGTPTVIASGGTAVDKGVLYLRNGIQTYYNLTINGHTFNYFAFGFEDGTIITVANAYDDNAATRFYNSDVGGTVQMIIGTAGAAGTWDNSVNYFRMYNSPANGVMKIGGVNTANKAVFTGTDIDWDVHTVGDHTEIQFIDYQIAATTGGNGVEIQVTGDMIQDGFTINNNDSYVCTTAGTTITTSGALNFAGAITLTGTGVGHITITSVNGGPVCNGITADISFDYVDVSNTGGAYGLWYQQLPNTNSISNSTFTANNNAALIQNANGIVSGFDTCTFSGPAPIGWLKGDITLGNGSFLELDTCTFSTVTLESTPCWLMSKDTNAVADDWDWWGAGDIEAGPDAGYRESDIPAASTFTVRNADAYSTGFDTEFTADVVTNNAGYEMDFVPGATRLTYTMANMTTSANDTFKCTTASTGFTIGPGADDFQNSGTINIQGTGVGRITIGTDIFRPSDAGTADITMDYVDVAATNDACNFQTTPNSCSIQNSTFSTSNADRTGIKLVGGVSVTGIINCTFSGGDDSTFSKTDVSVYAGSTLELDTCTYSTVGLQDTSGWIMSIDTNAVVNEWDWWGKGDIEADPSIGYREASIPAGSTFTVRNADKYSTGFDTEFTANVITNNSGYTMDFVPGTARLSYTIMGMRILGPDTWTCTTDNTVINGNAAERFQIQGTMIMNGSAGNNITVTGFEYIDLNTGCTLDFAYTDFDNNDNVNPTLLFWNVNAAITLTQIDNCSFTNAGTWGTVYTPQAGGQTLLFTTCAFSGGNGADWWTDEITVTNGQSIIFDNCTFVNETFGFEGPTGFIYSHDHRGVADDEYYYGRMDTSAGLAGYRATNWAAGSHLYLANAFQYGTVFNTAITMDEVAVNRPELVMKDPNSVLFIDANSYMR